MYIYGQYECIYTYTYVYVYTYKFIHVDVDIDNVIAIHACMMLSVSVMEVIPNSHIVLGGY